MQMTVLCGEFEEDLKVMVGHFVEMCKRCLKINADKSKVMVLGREEGLEDVSKLKYLGCLFG